MVFIEEIPDSPPAPVPAPAANPSTALVPFVPIVQPSPVTHARVTLPRRSHARRHYTSEKARLEEEQFLAVTFKTACVGISIICVLITSSALLALAMGAAAGYAFRADVIRNLNELFYLVRRLPAEVLIPGSILALGLLPTSWIAFCAAGGTGLAIGAVMEQPTKSLPLLFLR